MSDLARQVAETAAGLFGDDELIEEEEWIGLVTKAINSVGTLVSHEQAALLREVERALAGVETLRIGVLRRGEFVVDVLSDSGLMRSEEKGTNLTEALKSALDAAGVPELKGT